MWNLEGKDEMKVGGRLLEKNNGMGEGRREKAGEVRGRGRV
jgi:hypothetical protein